MAPADFTAQNFVGDAWDAFGHDGGVSPSPGEPNRSLGEIHFPLHILRKTVADVGARSGNRTRKTVRSRDFKSLANGTMRPSGEPLKNSTNVTAKPFLANQNTRSLTNSRVRL